MNKTDGGISDPSVPPAANRNAVQTWVIASATSGCADSPWSSAGKIELPVIAKTRHMPMTLAHGNTAGRRRSQTWLAW